jgi:hypothetical protein
VWLGDRSCFVGGSSSVRGGSPVDAGRCVRRLKEGADAEGVQHGAHAVGAVGAPAAMGGPSCIGATCLQLVGPAGMSSVAAGGSWPGGCVVQGAMCMECRSGALGWPRCGVQRSPAPCKQAALCCVGGMCLTRSVARLQCVLSWLTAALQGLLAVGRVRYQRHKRHSTCSRHSCMAVLLSWPASGGPRMGEVACASDIWCQP